MDRCPYCGSELSYCETIIVNKEEHKFYNLYSCDNDQCVTSKKHLTDCWGKIELKTPYSCYPEELLGLNA
jgi:hypothetical protein